MKVTIKKIINKVNQMITREEFVNTHKSKSSDFTRKRKLSFETIVLFVLGLTNSCLDFERINFCKTSALDSISNAALSKSRDKVNYKAFRELLTETQKLIPSKSTFKGYRVIAVDGTKGNLPNTSELREKYKLPHNSNYPQFHAVASFDVLNCKFIDAEMDMSTTDERAAAYKLLENHIPEKDIFLYDRGFPSVALIQKINATNQFFVARVSKSFLKEVNEFATQKYLDKDVHIDCSSERIRNSRIKNLQSPYSFDLRCVKIILKSKEEEILITNLPRDSFTRKDIGHLYYLRWGIETAFNHLKNAINIEEFVGIKENSIKQEFYSILLKYNIIMQYTDESEIMAHWNKKNFKVGV